MLLYNNSLTKGLLRPSCNIGIFFPATLSFPRSVQKGERVQILQEAQLTSQPLSLLWLSSDPTTLPD